MGKTVATLLGALFVLIGIVGFVSPGFLNTHLSPAHNLVHIISGIAALYFGLAGRLAAARMFDIIFGVVYLLLGVLGWAVGVSQASTMPGMTADNHLWK